MQKFGLDNLQSQRLSEIELEIVDMQSTALGVDKKVQCDTRRSFSDFQVTLQNILYE